jgi:hypothetical protein
MQRTDRLLATNAPHALATTQARLPGLSIDSDR